MSSPPRALHPVEQSSYGRLGSTPDLLYEEGDLGAWRRRKEKGKGRARDSPEPEEEEEAYPPAQGDAEEQETKRVADTLARWSAAEKTRRQSLRRTSTLVLPPSPATLIRNASRTRRLPPVRPTSRFIEDLPSPRSSTSTLPSPHAHSSSGGSAGLLVGPRYETHPVSRVEEEGNPFADERVEEEGDYEARTETFELGGTGELRAGDARRREEREKNDGRNREEREVGWWEWVFCGCFGEEKEEERQEGRTNPNE